MKYLSVCSGIEAATVAWHDLGWKPVALSEIEKFPSAVLAHHYPHVPNVGDMTKFKEWNLEPIDLLVGGTPCQSFSVAGLRKGLDDPRGNLMLTFLAIAERERPKWIVWENVPGVLSSNGGRDFGTFLAALGELGYGWAFRVLDAQWFGVAQRRRRVFVVGCLGDQASAAAVLFESESVQRNPAPSREKGQGAAGGVIPSVAGSFDTECGGGKLTHQSVANGHIIGTITARMFNSLGARDVEEGALLPVAQPVAFYDYLGSQGGGVEVGVSPTLKKKDGVAVTQPVAPALTASNDPSRSPQSSEVTQQVTAVHSVTMQVRRLTPVECERLQGFPDGYTNIPWRKKDEAPDGPRYKALGNSMAVPCMAWIGQRIAEVDRGD